MRVGKWKLVNELGREVEKGERVVDFRGEDAMLVDGVPPLHSGSTGRVGVKREKLSGLQWVYPSVFGLVWKWETEDFKPREVSGEDDG